MTTGRSETTRRQAAPLLRGCRPRQWAKNLLVAAAPLAAGELLEPGVLGPTLVALIGFCLASSAVYLVNDVVDAERDRLHPIKRLRPIASGELSVRVALATAGVLAAGSLLLTGSVGVDLAGLVLSYLALQVAYAWWLKHYAVVDIAVVASGFLLRAVAGGIAAELPLSQWFLLVAGFGSLFIVAGKRYSELTTVGAELGTRDALIQYTPSYLRFVWGVSTAATLMSYSLWAFEIPQSGDVSWTAVSIAPFVLGVLRYAVDIDAGRAGEPEEILWKDHVLQAIGLIWLVCVLIGVARA